VVDGLRRERSIPQGSVLVFSLRRLSLRNCNRAVGRDGFPYIVIVEVSGARPKTAFSVQLTKRPGESFAGPFVGTFGERPVAAEDAITFSVTCSRRRP
jgi:hypothetical protein